MSFARTIGNYASLIKLSHTIFAMPFAMIGFFLGVKYVLYIAAYLPSANPVYQPLGARSWAIQLILVVLCMVFARSAAMAFNRYLDADIDARNQRTKVREIPAGVISRHNALWFVIINCVLFMTATFFLNKICFYLSPVALFVILFYSYTKRFTALCHFVLGIGLSLAPIGAYLAITGVFHLLPLLFSFAVLFWVSGFDIIYALQDIDFDRNEQLHSVPSLLGKQNAIRLSQFLHLLTAALILTAGMYGKFHWSYWIGAGLFISLLVYQHLLVKPNDLSRINLAFFTTNGIASVVFALFVVLSIFL